MGIPNSAERGGVTTIYGKRKFVFAANTNAGKQTALSLEGLSAVTMCMKRRMLIRYECLMTCPGLMLEFFLMPFILQSWSTVMPLRLAME